MRQIPGILTLALGVAGAGSGAWAFRLPAVDLEEIVVTAQRAQPIGQMESTSQATVLKARPYPGFSIGVPYA